MQMAKNMIQEDLHLVLEASKNELGKLKNENQSLKYEISVLEKYKKFNITNFPILMKISINLF